MAHDNPSIVVTGNVSDRMKNIDCLFAHNGMELEVHMPRAVPASPDLAEEHDRARPILLAAVEALAKALRG